MSTKEIRSLLESQRFLMNQVVNEWATELDKAIEEPWTQPNQLILDTVVANMREFAQDPTLAEPDPSVSDGINGQEGP